MLHELIVILVKLHAVFYFIASLCIVGCCRQSQVV